MKESFLRSIGASVIWSGLDRVTALAKHVVVAATLGLSAQLDVFYMAIGILGILVYSWANMLDVAGVPELTRLQGEGAGKSFDELSRGLFTLSLLTGCLLAWTWWLGRNLIGEMALGLENERQSMLRESLAWMAPVAAFYLPTRQLGAFFRSTRRFSIVYRAEFLVSLTVLALIFAFPKSPNVLSWSYSAGVAASFAFILALGWKQFRLFGNPFSAAVWSVMTATGPALLMLQVVRNAYVFMDRAFVSYLPQSAIGAFSYAWVLVNLVPAMMLGTSGFITVFSERQNDPKGANEALDDFLSMCLFIGIPVSAFCLFFAGDMVSALLERGLFSHADSELTARGLIGFSLAVTPLLLRFPLEIVYQVKRNLMAIVWRFLLGLILNALLNVLFLFVFHWGVLGIALATSIAETIMVFSALAAFPRMGLYLKWKEHFTWTLLLAAASLAAALVLGRLADFVDWKWKIVPAAAAYAALLIGLGLKSGRRESVLVRTTLLRIKGAARIA